MSIFGLVSPRAGIITIDMSNNTEMFKKLSDTGTAYTSGEPDFSPDF
jgi:hypothetical protein